MKRAQKKAWIKALRSGKYKQARNNLMTDKGFCCIGVLYDISADDYWVKRGRKWVTAADGAKGMLPRHLNDEWGLGKAEYTLTGMNDGGASFTRIADWIEENIEEDD